MAVQDAALAVAGLPVSRKPVRAAAVVAVLVAALTH
jgi:hypothetical protein